MDPILSVLAQLGLGVAANSVFEVIKQLHGSSVAKRELEAQIQNRIDLHGVNMRAETVIQALAENGYLQIRGSSLLAPDGLTFGSVLGGASMGHNTTFATSRTEIRAGQGAFMDTEGNAQVRQNPDGSISFHVGEGGNISIKTTKK